MTSCTEHPFLFPSTYLFIGETLESKTNKHLPTFPRFWIQIRFYQKDVSMKDLESRNKVGATFLILLVLHLLLSMWKAGMIKIVRWLWFPLLEPIQWFVNAYFLDSFLFKIPREISFQSLTLSGTMTIALHVI